MKSILKLFPIATLLFCGCKGDVGPAGPAGLSLSGDLIGYVYLMDINDANLKDNSGVEVSAEGRGIVSTTDTSGRFVLRGLSTGTYTVSFSKTGYGKWKDVGVQFVGGGQVYYGTRSLYQIPTYSVTNLAATISSGSVKVDGELSGILPNINYRSVTIFISSLSSVSSDPSNYVFTYSVSMSSSSTTLSASISPYFFYYYHISSGQTVYLVAYADSFFSGSYIDLATGRLHHPCINPIPSNVVSVIVP